jgi:hypothetical protein
MEYAPWCDGNNRVLLSDLRYLRESAAQLAAVAEPSGVGVITPTKGIAPQRALLAIGAQLAQAVDGPVTISQAWSRLKEWRQANDHRSPIPFWWFALAVDVLYSLDVAEFDGELLSVRRADAASTSRA